MATINPINSQMPVEVVLGGTGAATQTAYGVLCADPTGTGTMVNVGSGTSGQLLQSTGASAPNWVTATDPGGVIMLSTRTSSSNTGISLTSTSGTTTAPFFYDGSWIANINCIIDQLYVYIATNGSTGNFTITVLQNGSATSLTTTVTASTTGNFTDTNTAHAVYVKIGDTIACSVTKSTTANAFGSIAVRCTTA